MGCLYAELNDVKGAFLNGNFRNGEKIYMSVPKGFEKYYPVGMVLLLVKTLYGLKQSAYEYWIVLLEVLSKAKLR